MSSATKDNIQNNLSIYYVFNKLWLLDKPNRNNAKMLSKQFNERLLRNSDFSNNSRYFPNLFQRKRKKEWVSEREEIRENKTGFFERIVIFKLLILYQNFSERRYVFSRVIWDILKRNAVCSSNITNLNWNSILQWKWICMMILGQQYQIFS